MDAIRAFLSRKRALFSIFEKGWGGLPSGMAVYALISLNMSKYPWKCLNKLFWLCQDFEYSWSSQMFDRLLKMSWVLSKPRFWIWHSCICKGYAEFWIWLHTPQWCQNMSQYALMFLNMPEHGRILVNVPEWVWKCLNKG